MILILSNKLDTTTQKVCEWIKFLKGEYFYLDIEFFYRLFIGEFNQDLLEEYLENIRKSNVIWNRRWDYSLLTNNQSDFEKITLNEFKLFSKYCFRQIYDKFWMDKPESIVIDKLTQLDIAKQIGLETLPFKLTTNKSILKKFVQKEGKVVTKSMGTGVSIPSENGVLTTFTNLLDIKALENIPNSFALSFFQKHTEKIFDIKVVFIGNKLFPVAIDSQENTKTKTDFRRYDWSNPNRIVPHKLPKSIIEKLKFYMKTINLKFGIIDLILSKNKVFYFLEVNPIGQFSYLSNYSGYNLEKEVAKYLINKNIN